jgi:hypothetical protein
VRDAELLEVRDDCRGRLEVELFAELHPVRGPWLSPHKRCRSEPNSRTISGTINIYTRDPINFVRRGIIARQ